MRAPTHRWTNWNVPMPQFREQIAEVVTVVLQKRIAWCVRSENISNEVFFKCFKNWRREVLLPVVPCAHRAQPSTLTLGASMPCGAPRVPGQGSSSLCPSAPGVVINDGDDIASSMEVRILQADHNRQWRGPALCAPRIRRAAFLR